MSSQGDTPEANYVGQVSAIVHSGLDGGSSQKRELQYDFDIAGRIAATREKVGSTTLDTRSFTYDATSQVTGVSSTGGSAESYSYDGNGNRISVS